MFLPISRDPVHIFQNRFLRWNRGFKPVVLNTINPIIGRIFFRTYIGVPEFKNIKKIAVRVLQMKIWNIPHVQYIKWFHFFTTRNKFSRKMYFHLNLTRPSTSFDKELLVKKKLSSLSNNFCYINFFNFSKRVGHYI